MPPSFLPPQDAPLLWLSYPPQTSRSGKAARHARIVYFGYTRIVLQR